MENEKMTVTNNEEESLEFSSIVAQLAMTSPKRKRLSVINGMVNALVAVVSETQKESNGDNAEDALERMVLSWMSIGDGVIGTNFGKYIKEFNKKDIFPESE